MVGTPLVQPALKFGGWAVLEANHLNTQVSLYVCNQITKLKSAKFKTDE